MKGLATVVAIATSCVLHGAYSQEAPISYKGATLGASIQEYKRALPDQKCSPRGLYCQFFIELECGADKPDIRECWARNTFGGARVNYAKAEFRDDKLVYLVIRLSTAEASKAMEALQEKLGAPTRTSNEPFRTQGGSVSDNTELVWDTDQMLLTARRHGTSLGTGSIVLTTRAELAAQAADRTQKAKTGAKDL